MDREEIDFHASQHLRLLRQKHPGLFQKMVQRMSPGEREAHHPDSDEHECEEHQDRSARSRSSDEPMMTSRLDPRAISMPETVVGRPDGEVVCALVQALIDPDADESSFAQELREPCPVCGRRFSAEAALRHFPVCKKAHTRRQGGWMCGGEA